VETHLKGYKYFEIERDFFLIKINYSPSTFRRCQDSRERGKGD
jgi:hypothetical protein